MRFNVSYLILYLMLFNLSIAQLLLVPMNVCVILARRIHVFIRSEFKRQVGAYFEIKYKVEQLALVKGYNIEI